MNKQKLSIIIPMYNGEKTIARCLDSILHQSGADKYEIIAVNDGSTDLSAKIVAEYQTKHPNIILINQPNGGVSVARNNGIKCATGQYITFVDCDDMVGASYDAIFPYTTQPQCRHKESGAMQVSVLQTQQMPDIPALEQEYFSRMIDAADNAKADVAFAGKFTMNHPEKTLKLHTYATQNVFNRTPDDKNLILIDANNRENANFALYRREFLDKHGLRFMANMPLDEDMLFCILATLYAKHVVTVPKSSYIYIRNENSASCFADKRKENLAYARANLERFPIILNELQKHPQYAKSFKWYLGEFAAQGAAIDTRCQPELSAMRVEYPAIVCSQCPADTCEQCPYLPVILDKINDARVKYSPKNIKNR